MTVKRIKYRGIGKPGRPVISMTIAGIARSLVAAATEILEGSVQGMKASAGEERWFKAVARIKSVEESIFRMAVGGARNTPGWKELDALHRWKGQYYMFEIDTAFTHRQKQNADVLHDAIMIRELSYLGVFPKVFHLDGERELASPESAFQTARAYFPN